MTWVWNGSSISMRRSPMPPAPRTVTVISWKRKRERAWMRGTTSKEPAWVASLCSCSTPRSRPRVDSATLSAYQPAALAQRTFGSSWPFLTSASRPAKAVWTNLMLSGSSGKASQ